MLQSEHEGRDQGRSEFTSILEEFCLLSGCHAAILVDQEGEAVDYAGLGTPFDLRVSAAEWRLVLQLAHQGPVLRQEAIFFDVCRRVMLWLFTYRFRLSAFLNDP